MTFTFYTHAETTCTSSGSGTWSTSFSCSGTGDPVTYVIQAGDTITITSNVSGIDSLIISGVLVVNNGSKVSLNSGGIVMVDSGGSITGGNSGAKFEFANGTSVVGPFNVSGPSYADGSSTTFTSGTPLPVELVMFEARSNDAHIMLEWTTAMELDNRGFEIEYLFDNRWLTLAFVQAQTDNGRSLVTQTYSYLVARADLANSGSMKCFRLKQIDLDGTFSYSAIRCVTETTRLPEGRVMVYPNPAIDVVHVQCNSPEEGCEISLFDFTGKPVQLASVRDTEEHSLDLRNVPHGYYTLVVRDTEFHAIYRTTLIKH